ncbi:MAG: hypothetical protein U0175_39220 [Caldilineaceae bacterium]
MSNALILIVTILVTIWLTNLWLTARERWKNGRGLLHAARRTRFETEEMLWQANNHRAQGMRDVWLALTLFLFVAMICLFAGMAWVAFNNT